MSIWGVHYGKSNIANIICSRCQMRMAHADAVQDQNSPGLWGHEECMDAKDPWRLPPRQTENITLPHPRKDSPLDTTATDTESLLDDRP